MPDRLQEIRARLDVAQGYRVEWPDHTPGTLAEFIAHAPADIAWLLDELDIEHASAAYYKARVDCLTQRVAELEKRVRMYEVVKS